MTTQAQIRLKRTLTKLLDSVAREHHLRHQDEYANRYTMRSDFDAPIELMFEKSPSTPPYLWVLAEQASDLPDGAVPFEFYSKADLYQKPAKNGGMQYGRHSALEKMTLLGKSDLIRFELRSLADLNTVLGALAKVTPRRASEE